MRHMAALMAVSAAFVATPGAAQDFAPPMKGDRLIDGCLRSPAIIDRVCGDQSRRIIADRYCREKGFAHASSSRVVWSSIAARTYVLGDSVEPGGDPFVWFTSDLSGATFAAISCTSAAAPLAPVPVRFRDRDNNVHSLNAWEGDYVAVLSARSDIRPATMARLLRALDAGYAFYREATGYPPEPLFLYNGKLSIAQLPKTCGAACGYIGQSGIELGGPMLDDMIAAIEARNEFDQAVFYEFGRNFWFYSDRLTYEGEGGGDYSSAVVTGYAVLMRFLAMESANVSGGSFGAWSFPEFRAKVEGMIDRYAADPSQSWENTFALGKAQRDNPDRLGPTDLFASLCFRLRRDYGGNAFVERLWRAAGKQPMTGRLTDAADNFAVAASIAAGRDLSGRFAREWRWPVSAAARERISSALR